MGAVRQAIPPHLMLLLASQESHFISCFWGPSSQRSPLMSCFCERPRQVPSHHMLLGAVKPTTRFHLMLPKA
eukprot:12888543-Prorocentrum_lima.AAC.1